MVREQVTRGMDLRAIGGPNSVRLLISTKIDIICAIVHEKVAISSLHTYVMELRRSSLDIDWMPILNSDQGEWSNMQNLINTFCLPKLCNFLNCAPVAKQGNTSDCFAQTGFTDLDKGVQLINGSSFAEIEPLNRIKSANRTLAPLCWDSTEMDLMRQWGIHVLPLIECLFRTPPRYDAGTCGSQHEMTINLTCWNMRNVQRGHIPISRVVVPVV